MDDAHPGISNETLKAAYNYIEPYVGTALVLADTAVDYLAPKGSAFRKAYYHGRFLARALK